MIGARLLGFEDPGGVFTVMIQLGADPGGDVAVSRQDRCGGPRPAVEPEARRFALMVLLAFLPALVAGPLLADYVERVLYESPRVIAAAFILGGIVMLLVERMRAGRRVTEADRTPLGRARWHRRLPDAGAGSGRVALGRHDRGRPLLGLDRAAAAEFSFFLAMPTMTAAFVYELLDVRAYLTPGARWRSALASSMAFLAALARREAVPRVRRARPGSRRLPGTGLSQAARAGGLRRRSRAGASCDSVAAADAFWRGSSSRCRWRLASSALYLDFRYH